LFIFIKEKIMRYKIVFQAPGSNSKTTTYVNANSASDAKSQVQSRFNGAARILSCEED